MSAAVDHAHVEGFAAVRLTSPDGRSTAVVVPGLAMLACSLRRDGEELLGQRRGVRAYAETGSTMGIPLLYPWANRLSDLDAAGVVLDRGSELLRIDEATGLPIHGVRLRGAAWTTEASTVEDAALVSGTLDLAADRALRAALPWPHRLTVTHRLDDRGLAVTTTVVSTGDVPVPIAFGFHPYVALPDAPRSAWILRADVRERLELDERMLPTGRRSPVGPFDGPLGDRSLDDGYAMAAPGGLSVAGPRHRVEIALDRTYPFAQIYAPPGRDLIALEPMTAPTDALATRRDLPEVEPGGEFSAVFRVNVR